MKEPSITKNFFYNTFFQILSIITPFITTPYISRTLGADGIGIQSYTTSYQTYFSLIAVLGTYSYGAREISKSRNDEYNKSKLFWEIEFLTCFTSCISILGWMLFILFNKKYRIYYAVLTLNLFAAMLDISWFFSGIEQFSLLVIRNSILKIAGIVCVFLFVKSKDDLLLYMFLSSLTVLLSSASMWIGIRKEIMKINAKDLRVFRHFKETFVYFIPTIATSIYTVLDKTLIGLITSDAAENGYYQQADKMIGMAKSIVFASINSVVGVRISYLFVEERYDEIKSRIEYSINYIFFMGFGCVFGIMGVAKNFVPVFFGYGYDNVVYLLYILSPIIIIIGISNCLDSHYYTPSGRRVQSTKYVIAGSVMNLVWNLLLIPWLKSYGAAISSILAETLIMILYIRFNNSIISVFTLIQCGKRKLFSGIIMFVIIRMIGTMELAVIPRLCTQIFAGTFIYIFVLIVCNDVWTKRLILTGFCKFRRDKHEK